MSTTQFQDRVQPWLTACFGDEIASNKEERNHRFLEESLELVQAGGSTREEAHQLVDYVFNRPAGEPGQEVGGVMMTLAAWCLAHGLDMHAAGETELARVWTKVDQIRIKQANKPKHSPLPMAQSSVIQHVIAERARQISEEGYTPDHDDGHNDGSLAMAAAAYAIHAAAFPGHISARLMYERLDVAKQVWPWEPEGFKPSGRYRDLERAGALIFAAMEQIAREDQVDEEAAQCHAPA